MFALKSIFLSVDFYENLVESILSLFYCKLVDTEVNNEIAQQAGLITSPVYVYMKINIIINYHEKSLNTVCKYICWGSSIQIMHTDGC